MPTTSPPACYGSILVNQGLNAGASSRTTLLCTQVLGSTTAATANPGVLNTNQPYYANATWQWSGSTWANVSSGSSSSSLIVPALRKSGKLA